MLALRLARPARARRHQPAAADLDGLREAAASSTSARSCASARSSAGRPTASPLFAEALRAGRARGRSAIAARWWAIIVHARSRLGAARAAALPRRRGRRARRTGGERLIPADRALPGPADHRRSTADELATAARFTLPPAGAGWGFAEVARRHGDFALVGAVRRAGARRRRDASPRARLGLLRRRRRRRCAARPAEARSSAASRRRPGCGEAARAAAAALSPDGDIHATADYRRQVAAALAERTLTAALARCGRPGMKQADPRDRQRPGRASAPWSARTTLADFLREDLDLTGTHVGCEHGVCGACTVLLDGEPVRACLMLAVQAEGGAHDHRGLATDSSLAEAGRPAAGAGPALHPIQQAFWAKHGLQCGFCTPGSS